MGKGHKPSGAYRLFQKVATGIGVLVAAIGGVMFAADHSSVGGSLLVVGGTLLIHGLVALAVIRYEDGRADRAEPGG